MFNFFKKPAPEISEVNNSAYDWQKLTKSNVPIVGVLIDIKLAGLDATQLVSIKLKSLEIDAIDGCRLIFTGVVFTTLVLYENEVLAWRYTKPSYER